MTYLSLHINYNLDLIFTTIMYMVSNAIIGSIK